jgi:hypothetical protein
MSESATINPPAETKGDERQLFKTIVSVLIAAIAVIGAWVTWQATVLANDAGAENAAGLAATLNIEQSRTVNLTQLYQHYAAYTTFARYRELGQQADADWRRLASLSMDQDTAPRLSWMLGDIETQRDYAFDTASAGQYFFPTRYLEQDSSYNLRRESGEASAEAARQQDLNADQHFAKADDLRERSNGLVAVVIVQTLCLLLFTFAEILRSRLAYVAAGAGTLIMFGSIVAALIIGLP